MNSLNYDHETECIGNTNCTCADIIDARYLRNERGDLIDMDSFGDKVR
jgi:hypothetical protein